ncbi:MAG: hypothetical protein IPJ99_19385 [Betaproteobacteria bacterium]|nr:hypothetical protein [Betaproteobacteria bacterium]
MSSYLIDWGDGNSQTVNSGGNVSHTYGSTGNYTIGVSLSDEDGTFANPTTVAVAVNAATATLSLEAGANAALDEGATFSRNLSFSDGEDNGAAGWTYSIDYGDGTVVNGSTLVKNLDLNHVYGDGDATRTVTVSLTDVAGETASDSFQVQVNNVAPTAAVTGADSVSEGSVYTLNVGAVVEPGADTRTGYSIDWGDGSTQALTVAQWAAAAGSFTHTYADGGNGGTARNIVVQATDEDGTFTLGSKALTVNNAAPSLILSGNANTNEGASYVLHIEGSDAGGAADP